MGGREVEGGEGWGLEVRRAYVRSDGVGGGGGGSRVREENTTSESSSKNSHFRIIRS